MELDVPFYRTEQPLHALDRYPAGFAWVIFDDSANSVFAFRRSADTAGDDLLVVLNMTPVPRTDYRIGVPVPGTWTEVLNSDAQIYGGSGIGNGGSSATDAVPAHGHDCSLSLTLPPLAAIILRPPGRR
jgi:1,4-alpha-glucan branching enzyme